MTDDAKAAVCPLMGLLAVRNNLISKVELENGLRDIAGAQEPEEALKNYFLSNELISAQNIQRLARIAKTLEIRKKEYTFGAIAIKKGFINQSLLNLVLEEQKSDLREKKKPRRIGDMLVESGLMSAKQRDHILKLQNRLRKEPSSGAPKLAEDCLDAKAAVPEMKSVYISDGGILLQVDGEAMGAFMTKTDTFDEDIDAQEIKAILLEMGIVSGLVSDALIQGFIRSSGYRSKPFRVAKGNIPVDGRDGKIEYFFNT
ncbi:MAG: FapA family protein, partial [Desulfovibrionales bacterium]|nr:FapA family protein [Desulfovibrionales bacterium]